MAGLWIFLCSCLRAGESAPFIVIESASLSGIDLVDPMAVFKVVFNALPEEVLVLPTENYCYWQLRAAGKCLRGNIRLASGMRESGRISFAFEEYPRPARGSPIAGAIKPGASDGVAVTCPGPFSCVVKTADRRVTFALHQIPQLPPASFALRSGEVFVARTFDESGLPFFLLFDLKRRSFLWVLNEEKPVAESFLLTDIAASGQRTGFVFFIDADRKVLASVSQAARDANDYFDGPFDQLADNYADQANLRHFLELAYPQLRGRIDKWGHLAGSETPQRIAISGCTASESPEQAIRFVRQAVDSGDPILFISAAASRNTTNTR